MPDRATWIAAAIVCIPGTLSAQYRPASALAVPVDSTAVAPRPREQPTGLRAAVAFAGKLWSRDRTFSLLDENDALGGTSDSAYTQGIRFRWDFGAWPDSRAFDAGFRALSLSFLLPSDNAPPVRACLPKDGRHDRPCGFVYLSLAQTEYTPPDLRTTVPRYDTRPYAGYLYGSFGGTVMYERSAVTSELTVGTIGPRAAARATQSLAHWTWSSDAPQPMGWGNQLNDAWQVSLRNVYANELLEYCWNGCTTGKFEDVRLFDVVPNAELVLGTLMRRASFGGVAHLGYRFPDLATPYRIPTTAPHPDSVKGTHFHHDVGELLRGVGRSFWAMTFVSYDRRYVEANELITGSRNDGGDAGWRRLRRIGLERDVGEYAWGFSVGAERITAGWQKATRSAEYQPGGGPHRFGSAFISIFTPAQ